MKHIISLTIICFCFIASGNETIVTESSEKQMTELSIANYPNPGKKSRKNRRINKKRKRRCGQFARKGFAG